MPIYSIYSAILVAKGATVAVIDGGGDADDVDDCSRTFDELEEFDIGLDRSIDSDTRHISERLDNETPSETTENGANGGRPPTGGRR